MSSKATVPAQQVAEISVVLAKPHTHRGEHLKAGVNIKVTAKEKAWLEKRGVIGGQSEEMTHG
ncbi:MAG: hypothetical protein GTN60_03720 [Pseudomonas stutzeri]|uniref:DUF7210 family protein n=1 Tax=Stutzerimonas stutzeri group TaxID=136846 RepID=UPI0007758E30|nr:MULTISPECIES: hypothetical protein [Stutzerimonas stutzeri group]KXO81149.1 hypothetical protein AYK87_13370 [Stutzerimonas stutzeri]MDL0441839.1 hypothetical protein [Stutzerimonas frequens]NIM30419.1 hypothetical protein [Stutzerimonas stutzeri]NIM53625.1 hypothetical protein [Stutzerimonas stutzeri]NIM85932.1 hypothetical protein [Stutzerimonas stutzeri]